MTASSGPSTARADLAFKLVLLGITFIVGAMLIGILDPVVDDLLAQQAVHTETQAAQTGHDYLQQAWDWAPLFVGFLGIVQIIAGAVAENQQSGVRR